MKLIIKRFAFVLAFIGVYQQKQQQQQKKKKTKQNKMTIQDTEKGDFEANAKISLNAMLAE